MDLPKATVIDAHPHVQTHCLLESWHIQCEWTLSTGEGELCQDSIVLSFYYIFCITLLLLRTNLEPCCLIIIIPLLGFLVVDVVEARATEYIEPERY